MKRTGRTYFISARFLGYEKSFPAAISKCLKLEPLGLFVSTWISNSYALLKQFAQFQVLVNENKTNSKTTSGFFEISYHTLAG